MKLLIASDIHGSAYYCAELLRAFEREHADRLLLLGDILYHGPRNDLPRDYSPAQVAVQLNKLRDRILCVRGNCDSDVDQMVLDFPIMADYAVLSAGNSLVYATHGHIFSEEQPPKLCKGDVLLCGHTHVQACTRHDGFTYLNPGSVSIPKGDSVYGYMLLENGEFQWRELQSGAPIAGYAPFKP